MQDIGKKLASLLLILSATIFALTGGHALGSWLAEDMRDNLFTTGRLAASIIEDFQQGQVVYPGETIVKRVTVANTGAVDALVRVKVAKAWGWVGPGDEFILDETASTDNIILDYDTVAWQEIGAYHYYRGVLSPGETTARPLFTEVTIAEEADNSHMGQQARIEVIMESVQAAYGGPSVWGLTLADLGIDYTPSPVKTGPAAVIFKGPQAGFSFVTGPNDILCAWEDLIPGESRSQFVDIENDHSAAVPIYLRGENNYQADSAVEQELIDQLLQEHILIDIVDEMGNTVYNGPLGGRLNAETGETMKQYISLGDFGPHQKKTLHVGVFVSPQVDSRYSDLLGKITWVFQASGAEAPYPPKTGNGFKTGFYVLGLILSATALLLSVIVRKKSAPQQ